MSKQKSAKASAFISFADVAGFASPASSTTEDESAKVATTTTGTKASNLSPVYTGDDTELVIICKKILKKDNQTRLKAFQDLKKVLENRGNEVLPLFLPHFVYLYLRFSIDNAPKIRYYFQAILAQLISIDKRAFGPYMSVLVGPWWMLMCDPVPEVAQEAKAAFETAIPIKKRPQVMFHLAANHLYFMERNLQHKIETLSDTKQSSPEECEERFERVVSSTLLAISRMMELMSDESNLALSNGVPWNQNEAPQEYLALPNPNPSQPNAILKASSTIGYVDMFSSSYWKRLSSKYSRIRSAAFQLLSVTLERAHKVIETILESQPEVWERLQLAVLETLGTDVPLGSLETSLHFLVPFLKHFPALHARVAASNQNKTSNSRKGSQQPSKQLRTSDFFLVVLSKLRDLFQVNPKVVAHSLLMILSSFPFNECDSFVFHSRINDKQSGADNRVSVVFEAAIDLLEFASSCLASMPDSTSAEAIVEMNKPEVREAWDGNMLLQSYQVMIGEMQLELQVALFEIYTFLFLRKPSRSEQSAENTSEPLSAVSKPDMEQRLVRNYCGAMERIVYILVHLQSCRQSNGVVSGIEREYSEMSLDDFVSDAGNVVAENYSIFVRALSQMQKVVQRSVQQQSTEDNMHNLDINSGTDFAALNGIFKRLSLTIQYQWQHLSSICQSQSDVVFSSTTFRFFQVLVDILGRVAANTSASDAIGIAIVVDSLRQEIQAVSHPNISDLKMRIVKYKVQTNLDMIIMRGKVLKTNNNNNNEQELGLIRNICDEIDSSSKKSISVDSYLQSALNMMVSHHFDDNICTQHKLDFAINIVNEKIASLQGKQGLLDESKTPMASLHYLLFAIHSLLTRDAKQGEQSVGESDTISAVISSQFLSLSHRLIDSLLRSLLSPDVSVPYSIPLLNRMEDLCVLLWLTRYVDSKETSALETVMSHLHSVLAEPDRGDTSVSIDETTLESIQYPISPPRTLLTASLALQLLSHHDAKDRDLFLSHLQQKELVPNLLVLFANVFVDLTISDVESGRESNFVAVCLNHFTKKVSCSLSAVDLDALCMDVLCPRFQIKAVSPNSVLSRTDFWLRGVKAVLSMHSYNGPREIAKEAFLHIVFGNTSDSHNSNSDNIWRNRYSSLSYLYRELLDDCAMVTDVDIGDTLTIIDKTCKALHELLWGDLLSKHLNQLLQTPSMSSNLVFLTMTMYLTRDLIQEFNLTNAFGFMPMLESLEHLLSSVFSRYSQLETSEGHSSASNAFIISCLQNISTMFDDCTDSSPFLSFMHANNKHLSQSWALLATAINASEVSNASDSASQVGSPMVCFGWCDESPAVGGSCSLVREVFQQPSTEFPDVEISRTETWIRGKCDVVAVHLDDPSAQYCTVRYGMPPREVQVDCDRLLDYFENGISGDSGDDRDAHDLLAYVDTCRIDAVVPVSLSESYVYSVAWQLQQLLLGSGHHSHEALASRIAVLQFLMHISHRCVGADEQSLWSSVVPVVRGVLYRTASQLVAGRARVEPWLQAFVLLLDLPRELQSQVIGQGSYFPVMFRHLERVLAPNDDDSEDDVQQVFSGREKPSFVLALSLTRLLHDRFVCDLNNTLSDSMSTVFFDYSQQMVSESNANNAVELFAGDKIIRLQFLQTVLLTWKNAYFINSNNSETTTDPTESFIYNRALATHETFALKVAFEVVMEHELPSQDADNKCSSAASKSWMDLQLLEVSQRLLLLSINFNPQFLVEVFAILFSEIPRFESRLIHYLVTADTTEISESLGSIETKRSTSVLKLLITHYFEYLFANNIRFHTSEASSVSSPSHTLVREVKIVEAEKVIQIALTSNGATELVPIEQEELDDADVSVEHCNALVRAVVGADLLDALDTLVKDYMAITGTGNKASSGSPRSPRSPARSPQFPAEEDREAVDSENAESNAALLDEDDDEDESQQLAASSIRVNEINNKLTSLALLYVLVLQKADFFDGYKVVVDDKNDTPLSFRGLMSKFLENRFYLPILIPQFLSKISKRLMANSSWKCSQLIFEILNNELRRELESLSLVSFARRTVTMDHRDNLTDLVGKMSLYALFKTIFNVPLVFKGFYQSSANAVEAPNESSTDFHRLMHRLYANAQLNRSHKAKVVKFIEDRMKNDLIQREVTRVREHFEGTQSESSGNSAASPSTNNFQVRCSVITGEIIATLYQEEVKIEVKLILPKHFPLQNVTVEFLSKLGMKEDRLRKWKLQINKILMSNENSIVDALTAWKMNVLHEVQDIQECPICYLTFHAKTAALPNMKCDTCRNIFHAQCLHQWFKTSGKHKCVICQQPFFK